MAVTATAARGLHRFFATEWQGTKDFDDVADMVVAAGPIAAFAWRHECHVGRATAARRHAAKKVRNDHDVYDDLVNFYSLGAMTGHGAPPARETSIAGTVF